MEEEDEVELIKEIGREKERIKEIREEKNMKSWNEMRNIESEIEN